MQPQARGRTAETDSPPPCSSSYSLIAASLLASIGCSGFAKGYQSAMVDVGGIDQIATQLVISKKSQSEEPGMTGTFFLACRSSAFRLPTHSKKSRLAELTGGGRNQDPDAAADPK